MNLAINGIRLVGQRFGVGRYIEYLLRNWATMDWPFKQTRLYTTHAIAEPFALPSFVEHRIIPASHSYAYWEQVTLPWQCRKNDLLFCPSYVVPLGARCRTVVTHHGSYEAIPSAFSLAARAKARLMYQLSAIKADLIITVSESSKRDIIRFYGLSPAKIKVIPQGVNPAFRPVDDPEAMREVRTRYFGSNRPFILFVGKLSKRRNIPELMAAFARFKREHRLCHGLLLMGENSIGLNIQQMAKDLGVEGSVIHQAYADHASLINIYNAADLFVYPSSYEGFGVPVLEAMACGVPAITLANSSLVEFASGAAYLCQDGSAAELYRGLVTVLFDTDLQAKLRTEGIERSRDFGWDRIARQTLNVLVAVAQR